MKIRLADVLDSAAWTILVAGSLGVSTAVMGQTSPYSILDKPKAIPHGANEVKSLQQTTKSSRVAEIKVELAWLADPVTSPCRLEARAVGGTLEVHGQAPNEAVLGHALHLAGAESGLRVVNRVQINPGLRAPSGGKTQEALHRDAFNALRQGFPDKAPSIAISTLPGGEITLKGTIPTYEEKLALSRHLHQATACSCVINQLQVLAEPQESRMQSGSLATTATLLAPEPLKSKSVQPVAHVPHAESMSPVTTLPAPNSSAGTTISSSPKSSAVASAKPSVPKSAAQADSSTALPAQESPAATEAKPAAKPVVYRTKWRRLDPGEIAMSSRVIPPSAWKETAGAAPRDGSAAHPRGRIVSPSFTTEETTVLPQHPLPLESGKIQPLERTTDITSTRPPNVVAPTKGSPEPIPPAGPKTLAVARGEAYVADGVIIMDSMIKPASHAVPATASGPPTILKTGPYVSNGVIVFSDPANERLIQANPALAALQTHLQQRIAAVCGKSNNDVEVRAVTETELTVRLKANSTLEGEALSNRIFQLPELGPCQVSLDVLVMK
jgi:hypothetical protein